MFTVWLGGSVGFEGGWGGLVLQSLTGSCLTNVSMIGSCLIASCLGCIFSSLKKGEEEAAIVGGDSEFSTCLGLCMTLALRAATSSSSCFLAACCSARSFCWENTCSLSEMISFWAVSGSLTRHLASYIIMWSWFGEVFPLCMVISRFI